jgi:hypothetical protein
VRKRILILGLLLTAVAVPARADTITTYNITFTASTGTAPTFGQFTYDSTTPNFISFTVIWDGHTYDMTASPGNANAPGTNATGCTGEGSPGAAYGFEIMSQTLTGCPSAPTYVWQTGTTSIAPSYFDFYATVPPGHYDYIEGQNSAVADSNVSKGTWSIAPVPPTTTPEPGTLALVLTGSLSALLLARRQRKA